MAAAFSPISNQVTQQFGDRVYFLFLFFSTTAYRNFTFVLDIDTELITTQLLRTFYRNNLLHKTDFQQMHVETVYISTLLPVFSNPSARPKTG
jgi:hypothetical protein